MTKFINTELKSEPESELQSDTELVANLESDYSQLITFFEQVKRLEVILLTSSILKHYFSIWSLVLKVKKLVML